MRSTLCLALILAAVVLVPVRALGAEPLSPMVVQGLEQLSRAKATYTPTVSVWPTASAITYGQTLASSTLTGGTTSVEGSFAFDTSTTVPGVGTFSAPATFTPTDTANFNTVAGTVNVTVNAASGTTTPTISAWPTASPISKGQTLASSTLTGGTASVPGTFAFTDSTIKPSAVGTYSATVTFTPTDTTLYSGVSGTVNVTVNPPTYTLIDYLGIPLLALLAVAIVRLAEGNRGGGPCFIATAAWGTPLAPEIDRLREFRDNTLLTGVLGTAAVDLYYHVSPAIADLVAASPALAMVVRMALIPVLVLVSLPVPLVMGAGLLAGAVLLRRIVRRNRADREQAE